MAEETVGSLKEGQSVLERLAEREHELRDQVRDLASELEAFVGEQLAAIEHEARVLTEREERVRDAESLEAELTVERERLEAVANDLAERERAAATARADIEARRRALAEEES